MKGRQILFDVARKLLTFHPSCKDHKLWYSDCLGGESFETGEDKETGEGFANSLEARVEFLEMKSEQLGAAQVRITEVEDTQGSVGSMAKSC